MFDKQLFQRDPRSYALELVDNGLSAQVLLEAALQYMSYDEVRHMLDINELSPRFDEDAEDEDFISEEDAQAIMDDVNYVGNRSHY